MKQLENVEEKQRVAKELQELVDKINEIMEAAPLFLPIRFTQNTGQMGGKNAHLQVWVTETVHYR